MNTRSETRTINGASVEVGTVTFQGRDFSALGSVVDHASGVVCAYVTRDVDGTYRLTTWEGGTIAPLLLVSSWMQRRLFGGFPVRIYAWRATIDGRTYSGRNTGPGMFVRLRARTTPQARLDFVNNRGE
jgi:hypothetical protein